MSLVLRKPVFGVSDQVPHKSGCTATEDGQRLEISHLGGTIRIAKTKALISFAVFVFAYAKNPIFSRRGSYKYWFQANRTGPGKKPESMNFVPAVRCKK